jgi:hypothetical protein
VLILLLPALFFFAAAFFTWFCWRTIYDWHLRRNEEHPDSVSTRALNLWMRGNPQRTGLSIYRMNVWGAGLGLFGAALVLTLIAIGVLR